MRRYLNVGIMQMPVAEETRDNLEYISRMVDALMANYHTPELVIGVEYGIGVRPESIPGPATEFLGNIAKRHGIYFIPGSMAELHPDLQEGQFYNAAPVFGPDGSIIAVYRKMCPWYPAEHAVPGREYVVFDIPEKRAKIGVQICYDAYFPEISRNEVLMGAEVLVKLTMDPDPLHKPYSALPIVRAIENQAYFISTNGTGFFGGHSLYGHSVVVDPEARVLWEAEREPAIATVTLDLSLVEITREYGAFFMDQTLKHLRYFNLPMPYANNVAEAPLYARLGPPANTVADYDSKVRELGVATIGHRTAAKLARPAPRP